MHQETVHVGAFDATKRPEFLPTANRDTWFAQLEKNLSEHDAIQIIDGRDGTLPKLFTDRLTPEHLQETKTLFTDLFGKDWQKDTEGKTIAVLYTKFGHGHKHQALDLSLTLAHLTKSRIVLFDPVDALPPRERKVMEYKIRIHKAMQTRDENILKALWEEMIHMPKGAPVFHTFDQATNKLGYGLAKLTMKFLPAQEETGNKGADIPPSKLMNMMEVMLNKYPQRFVKPFIQAEARLTERSVAAAAAAVAAKYEADAILTTHPNAIRSLTPSVLAWIPSRLRKKARHALQTIITVTPDNGYTQRKADGSEERGLSNKETMDDIILTSPFSFPLHKRASWLKRALHVVADDLVAKRFHDYWGIPESQLFPFGTVADDITAKQLKEKWSQKEKRILFASNGNGSNIPESIKAIQEIAAVSPDWLAKNTYHLDIFLADHPEKVADVLKALEDAGMKDQAEVIDYTNDFFRKQKSFSYSTDPTKRIHIAFGTGDVAGSELKQCMQRLAHVEIRSPGENALSGAYVGAVELCTPPGGPNEIYNMIWTGKHKLASAINWNADAKAVRWESAGMTKDLGLIPDTDAATIPTLIDTLFSGTKAVDMAHTAYDRSQTRTSHAVTGLLIGELRRRETLPTPSREQVAGRLRAYLSEKTPA